VCGWSHPNLTSQVTLPRSRLPAPLLVGFVQVFVVGVGTLMWEVTVVLCTSYIAPTSLHPALGGLAQSGHARVLWYCLTDCDLCCLVPPVLVRLYDV